MTQSETSFWARRRAGVKAEEAALSANEQRLKAEELARIQEEKTDEELLVELDLKDPDLMEMGDDFSAFMQTAVPERLRRRALRKLWVSNPVLANLDGLVDHGEDYSDAATVIPDLKTSYQVGKGLLKHVLALAEQEAAKNAPATPAASDPSVNDESEDGELSDDEYLAVDEPVLALADPEPAEPPALSRRHMRFSFES